MYFKSRLKNEISFDKDISNVSDFMTTVHGNEDISEVIEETYISLFSKNFN